MDSCLLPEKTVNQLFGNTRLKSRRGYDADFDEWKMQDVCKVVALSAVMCIFAAGYGFCRSRGYAGSDKKGESDFTV